MRALYFPFTTIPEPVLGALLACFRQVAVYQPSRSHVPESLRNWEAEGRLRLHLPNNNGNDPLPHLIQAYRAWAELHKGERPDFEKFRPPVAPYTDEFATSRIRSSIRREAKGTGTMPFQEDEEGSMLLTARLFLTLAQEHDLLRQALRKDLDRIEKMEKELFRNLISDRNEPFPVGSSNRTIEPVEDDCFCCVPRMTAWARLHAHYRKIAGAESASMPKMTDLLITSDWFALNQLLDQADEADAIWDIDGIPFSPPTNGFEEVFFNEPRCDKLKRMIAERAPSTKWYDCFPDSENEYVGTGRLTLYRVKGDIVTRFLSKTEHRPEPSRMRSDTPEKCHMLAGSIVQKGPF